VIGQAVIIPSEHAGYVELGSSGGAPRFRKEILRCGPLHYQGQQIDISPVVADQLVANFRSRVCDIVQFPLATSGNTHTEDPMANAGRVVDIAREGDGIVATIEVRKPEVAEGIRRGTVLGCSAMINLDYTDTRSGKKAGPTLLHVLATNRPHCLDLQPYQEVLAATAPGGDVLMLTAAPATPAQLTSMTRSWRPAMLAEITDDDLTARMERYLGLTGYTGQDDGPTATELEVDRLVALAGHRAAPARSLPPSPMTDLRRAVAEVAVLRGFDYSPTGLSRALDALVDMHAEQLELTSPGAGDELRLSMGTSDELALAGCYALPAGTYGDKPKLPCDSPELVRRSWEVLHQHYRHRLSAEDFEDARTELIDAADRFGFIVNDGRPLQPAIAASVPQLSLSAVAGEVDRYLALAGQPSAGSRADSFGPTTFPAGVPARDAANLIVERSDSEAFRRSRGRNRVAEQRLEREVTRPSQDALSSANPTRGGQVHPEVERLMREHPGAFEQSFGAERPQHGSRSIRPKAAGQRALERRRSRPRPH
jgi:hypothetical protein